MEEEWRNVEEYEGLYEVSNTGKVKSLYFGKSKILKQAKTSSKKYLKVNLYKDGKSKSKFVHSLVAKSFPEICGEWFDSAVVNHKDENGFNNSAENLEVCTIKYNSNYGTGKCKMGERHKVPVNQYSMDGEFIKEYPSALEAQKETGINRSSISSACHNRKYRTCAGGFKWRFKKEGD